MAGSGDARNDKTGRGSVALIYKKISLSLFFSNTRFTKPALFLGGWGGRGVG